MTFVAWSWARPSCVCATSTLRSDDSSAEVDWCNMRVEGEGMDDNEGDLSRARFGVASRILVSVASFFEVSTRDDIIVCSCDRRA